jgi:hypothetical protein
MSNQIRVTINKDSLTKEMCNFLISQSYDNFPYIPDELKTSEMCFEAMKKGSIYNFEKYIPDHLKTQEMADYYFTYDRSFCFRDYNNTITEKLLTEEMFLYAFLDPDIKSRIHYSIKEKNEPFFSKEINDKFLNKELTEIIEKNNENALIQYCITRINNTRINIMLDNIQFSGESDSDFMSVCLYSPKEEFARKVYKAARKNKVILYVNSDRKKRLAKSEYLISTKARLMTFA